MDCLWFCIKEDRCESLNYAHSGSVGDGGRNCELLSESENDEGLLKDERYAFYQIFENQPKQVL